MDNIKEEFNALFDDDDSEKTSKNTVPIEKYEELKVSVKQNAGAKSCYVSMSEAFYTLNASLFSYWTVWGQSINS